MSFAGTIINNLRGIFAKSIASAFSLLYPKLEELLFSILLDAHLLETVPFLFVWFFFSMSWRPKGIFFFRTLTSHNL